MLSPRKKIMIVSVFSPWDRKMTTLNLGTSNVNSSNLSQSNSTMPRSLSLSAHPQAVRPTMRLAKSSGSWPLSMTPQQAFSLSSVKATHFYIPVLRLYHYGNLLPPRCWQRNKLTGTAALRIQQLQQSHGVMWKQLWMKFSMPTFWLYLTHASRQRLQLGLGTMNTWRH